MSAPEIVLLPCPFCGGKLEVTKHYKIDAYGATHRCKFVGPIVFDFQDKKTIEKAWNHRHKEAP